MHVYLIIIPYKFSAKSSPAHRAGACCELLLAKRQADVRCLPRHFGRKVWSVQVQPVPGRLHRSLDQRSHLPALSGTTEVTGARRQSKAQLSSKFNQSEMSIIESDT